VLTYCLACFARYVDPACGDVDKSILSYRAPTTVRGRTVTFAGGGTFDADIIVLATGYRQTFPFLHAKMAAPAAPPAAPPAAAPAAPAVAPAAPAAPPPSGARERGGARSPARASRSPPRSRPAATAATAATAAAGTPGAGGRAAEGGGSTEAEGSSYYSYYASWRAGSGARGAEDPLPPEHFILSPDEPTLAFIGFVRPNVGAIPPMSELQVMWWIQWLRWLGVTLALNLALTPTLTLTLTQVMWWIQRLRGKVARTSTPPSYGLLGRKLTYGVDYGNYMHQLAAEFGGAPSLRTLALRSPRVLVAYCLGQAYISFLGLGLLTLTLTLTLTLIP